MSATRRFRAPKPPAADAGVAERIARIGAAAKAAGVKLRRGATPAAIAKLEATLGVALPPEVRAFYLAHNGGPAESLVLGTGTDDRLGLHSLDEIRSEWEQWNEASEDFEDEDVEPARGVRKKWWIPAWIPVTYDYSGNHCAIDLSPTKAGTVGQIIEVWHDDGARTVRGKDFLSWLEAETWSADDSLGSAEDDDDDEAVSVSAVTVAPGEESLAEKIARARAIARKGTTKARVDAHSILEWLAVFRPLGSAMRVYPKQRRDELTSEQHAYVEALVEVGIGGNWVGDGLFDDDAQLARFIGRAPAGPSDVMIVVEGKHAPLWWAVSAVGSGHARAEAVLAGWRALAPKDALAAYSEIASGKAYDVLEARLVSGRIDKIGRLTEGYHCNQYAEPHQKLYRERVVTLLAEVSLAFGAEGEAAARALVKSLPAPLTRSRARFVVDGKEVVPAPGAGQAFVALLSGVRHAAADKGVVDEAFDAANAHLWARIAQDHFFAPKIVQAIAKGLPKPRAEAFKRAVAEPA